MKAPTRGRSDFGLVVSTARFHSMIIIGVFDPLAMVLNNVINIIYLFKLGIIINFI